MRKLASIDKDYFAQKSLHDSHVRRIARAQSLIDVKVRPIVQPQVMMMHKLKKDAIVFRQIKNKNKAFLEKFITIHNNTQLDAAVDLYRKRVSLTNMKKARARARDLERSNHHLGCRLLSVKSTMNTLSNIGLCPYPEREKFEVPQETLDIYRYVVMPTEISMLEQLLRPKIFLDLQLDEKYPVGRLTIQLFTEACPEVVLEFVRMCSLRRLQALQFIRIFTSLWIESELIFSTPALKQRGFEYDENILDHGYGPGVLSFSRWYLNGFCNGLINFSIAFRPLPLMQSERISFGIVTSGLRLIHYLECFGSRNGTTKAVLTVTECGMVT